MPESVTNPSPIYSSSSTIIGGWIINLQKNLRTLINFSPTLCNFIFLFHSKILHISDSQSLITLAQQFISMIQLKNNNTTITESSRVKIQYLVRPKSVRLTRFGAAFLHLETLTRRRGGKLWAIFVDFVSVKPLHRDSDPVSSLIDSQCCFFCFHVCVVTVLKGVGDDEFWWALVIVWFAVYGIRACNANATSEIQNGFLGAFAYCLLKEWTRFMALDVSLGFHYNPIPFGPKAQMCYATHVDFHCNTPLFAFFTLWVGWALAH